MNGKRTVRLIVSLLLSSVVLLMCTFFASLAVRAQQALTPHADYVNALWVVGSDEILKVASADGSVVFTIPSVQDVRAVAVDARRGILWAYGDNTLHAYSFSGTFILSVPITQPDEDDEHNALVVNSDDGTVWLGVHQTLLHLGAHGQLLRTIYLPDNVQALGLDTTTARLWVGTKKTVSAYNDAGYLVASIQLGQNPEVTALAVDASSGDLWIALQKTLRLYDADVGMVAHGSRPTKSCSGWIMLASGCSRYSRLLAVTSSLLWWQILPISPPGWPATEPSPRSARRD